MDKNKVKELKRENQNIRELVNELSKELSSCHELEDTDEALLFAGGIRYALGKFKEVLNK